MSTALTLASALGDFADGIKFLVREQDGNYRDSRIGGWNEIGPLLGNHLKLSGLSVLFATLIAVPIGMLLGHIGRFQILATSVSNIGRAVPSLALIAFFFVYLGPSTANIVLALTLLAIPPLFTNAYVAVRQVDRDTVDAARGMGFSEARILTRVELPMSLPLIFGGLRTAAVSVVATATIAPLAGVDSLGTPLIARGVYGVPGTVGAAIAVALLAVIVEVGFGALQRAITPRGLKLTTDGAKLKRRAVITTPQQKALQAP